MQCSTHHTGTPEMKSLAFFSATLATALPLIDAQIAQAKTSVKTTVQITKNQTAKNQTTKKRDRSSRIAAKLPLLQIIQPRSPQPLPLASPMTVSYTYSAPSYNTPSAIDRPICFIEQSNGTFIDLSKLCGTKTKNEPLNFNSNSTMPSYPIYPGDLQPQ